MLTPSNDCRSCVLLVCLVVRTEICLHSVGPLVIAPLLSWHHAAWDQEPDVDPARRFPVADYEACVWPPGVPGAWGCEVFLRRVLRCIDKCALRSVLRCIEMCVEVH